MTEKTVTLIATGNNAVIGSLRFTRKKASVHEKGSRLRNYEQQKKAPALVLCKLAC